MTAESVVEELARDELTHDHVQRRVDDWAKRIEQLYDAVENWLPAGWNARRGAARVTMHEPLMDRLGIAPRHLPTLELIRDGEVSVTFRPDGLWIIGTNGRIDLIKGKVRYVVLDRAGTFEPPEWQAAPASPRRDSKKFDRAWLQTLLAT
jgi:hypothetical protein